MSLKIYMFLVTSFASLYG